MATAQAPVVCVVEIHEPAVYKVNRAETEQTLGEKTHTHTRTHSKRPYLPPSEQDTQSRDSGESAKHKYAQRGEGTARGRTDQRGR